MGMQLSGMSCAAPQSAAALSEEQRTVIDEELLANCQRYWRRMSMVVGMSMEALAPELGALPEIYYARRLSAMVNAGLLDGRGDLVAMADCELRLAR